MGRRIQTTIYVILAILAIEYGLSRYYKKQFVTKMRDMVRTVGDETLKDPELLKESLNAYGLETIKQRLTLFYPVGPVVYRQVRRLEDSVLYLSENAALPEAERFPDRVEARKYGIDPDEKSDVAIGKYMAALIEAEL